MNKNHSSSLLLLTTYNKFIWAEELRKTTNNLTRIAISQIYLLHQKTAKITSWIVRKKTDKKTEDLFTGVGWEFIVPVSWWVLPCFANNAYLYIQDTNTALRILFCTFLWSFLCSCLCCFAGSLLLDFLFIPRRFVVFGRSRICLIPRNLILTRINTAKKLTN